jgi:hypothetical protein
LADAIAQAAQWSRELRRSERFHTLRSFLAELDENAFPDLRALNELAARFALRSADDLPLRFVPPGAEKSYEQAVYDSGCVCTRPQNWHDLFNALAWCAFPRSKALLNRLHVDQLTRRDPSAGRGTVRDVLTLFDESGMIVACADPALARLLEEFRWKDLFVERRESVAASMSFHVFGHAIHEQMLDPFDGITAKAVVFEVDRGFFGLDERTRLKELDARTAEHFFRPQSLESTRNLQPVPVLGIPGWWPANEAAHYYDNTAYFRPRRP